MAGWRRCGATDGGRLKALGIGAAGELGRRIGMDAAAAPVGLLLSQDGLRETGVWCDKLKMWRRHMRLSDGRYVDLVEDYSASDTGAYYRLGRIDVRWRPLTAVGTMQMVPGYCGAALWCSPGASSRRPSTQSMP